VGLLVDNDGIARNPISDPAWRTSNAPYVMRDFESPRCMLRPAFDDAFRLLIINRDQKVEVRADC
jgi:hypothetical protein